MAPSYAILLTVLSIFSRFCSIQSFHTPLFNSQPFKQCTRTFNQKNSVREVSYSSRCSRNFKIASTKIEEPESVVSDDIFGAEFKAAEKERTYWKGNQQYTEISPEKRGKVMKGYDNLRITFLLDNLFISALGLCLLWSFGTSKDAFSYGVGSLLGLGYAALLARYVESLGSKSGGGAGGGAARFAPVVLLILLYSKNKQYISIVPEILGFFTFQVASLLQIFNEDAYGESESESDKK